MGQRAHRGQHVRGLEAAGRARRARRDREAEPVELGDQGLAVDVEAGERHARAGAGRTGSPTTSTSSSARQPGAQPVDEPRWRAPTSSRSATTACRAAAAASDGRDVLEPGDPGVGAVVGRERRAPAGALADQQHADARRARPTCARTRPRPAHPPAASTRPAAARGVREERHVVPGGRLRDLGERLQRARPPGSPTWTATTPGRLGRQRPPRARRGDPALRRRRAPPPSYRRSGGPPAPRRPAPPSARPRCAPAGGWSVGARAAARARPRWTACVPEEVNGPRPGGRRAARRRPRGRCRAAAGPRGRRRAAAAGRRNHGPAPRAASRGRPGAAARWRPRRGRRGRPAAGRPGDPVGTSHRGNYRPTYRRTRPCLSSNVLPDRRVARERLCRWVCNSPSAPRTRSALVAIGVRRGCCCSASCSAAETRTRSSVWRSPSGVTDRSRRDARPLDGRLARGDASSASSSGA